MSETASGSYFIGTELMEEMVRLMEQDHLFTQAMGGPWGELPLHGINRVLDVGTGAGGWALEVAFQHPEVEVMGIDISDTMLEYAEVQAEAQGLSTIRFLKKDISVLPLDFPDASFDLVNARLLAFFTPDFWPRLVQEYVRMTRPGGLIRLTETEMSVSNSPALEQEQAWFFRSLWKAGQSFSANGERLTITAMLPSLLRQAGCQNVNVRAYAIDWAFGTPAHETMCLNVSTAMRLLQPFFLATGVATQQAMDQVYEQMRAEMHQPAFSAVHYLLTASGEKAW